MNFFERFGYRLLLLAMPKLRARLEKAEDKAEVAFQASIDNRNRIEEIEKWQEEAEDKMEL